MRPYFLYIITQQQYRQGKGKWNNKKKNYSTSPSRTKKFVPPHSFMHHSRCAWNPSSESICVAVWTVDAAPFKRVEHSLRTTIATEFWKVNALKKLKWLGAIKENSKGFTCTATGASHIGMLQAYWYMPNFFFQAVVLFSATIVYRALKAPTF